MDSILFDLDGTLWNATTTIVRPWNEVFAEFGIERTLTQEDMYGLMGLLADEIAQKLLPSVSPTIQKQIIARCCSWETTYLRKEGGVLYPSVEDTLSALSKKYPLFIVSNCEDGYIEAFYEAHGLKKYFKDYEYAGRTGLEKGENIKLVINKYGLDAPVYVGDTHKDQEAAELAGIPFIFASYGFGSASDYATRLEQFKDLPAIMERLEN